MNNDFGEIQGWPNDEIAPKRSEFFGKDDFPVFEKPLKTSHLSILRKRKFIADMTRNTLNALIPSLPDQNTDVYILSNGSGAERRDGSDSGVFDFGSFIPYLADLVAAKEVLVSTWTMNMRGADNVVEIMERTGIERVIVLTDPYFNSREPIVASYVLSVARKKDNCHYVAFRNHAKVIAMRGENGFAVVTGSANFSSQPRVEQFVLSASPDVFDFFRINLFEWALAQI